MDTVIETPRADSWELAAKIGGVLALVGSLLRWLLTPAFVHGTRKALEPEIKAMQRAAERFAKGDARFAAIERDLTELREDVRDLRQRVDDVVGGGR